MLIKKYQMKIDVYSWTLILQVKIAISNGNKRIILLFLMGMEEISVLVFLIKECINTLEDKSILLLIQS